MLQPADIICFSSDWGQDPLSKHHIVKILATRNRVLWVNSIGMRRPSATRQDALRALSKLGRFFARRTQTVAPGITVLNPLVAPIHGNPVIDRFNAWWLSRQVKKAASKLGFQQPMLLSFLPNMVGVCGRLGEILVVYYITDDFTKFTGHPSAAIGRMEGELISRADLVVASAKELAALKSRFGKPVALIPHGVDHAHFAAALMMRPGQFPDDVKNIKHPVIGFYGEINDWIDTDMLASLARLRPDWSLVLLGRIAAEAGNLGHLLKLPNVRWLGQKRYQELPAYCAAFDVALIPMKLNDLTRSVNPLKLREYLAAGVPVVSAPLPEALPYGDVVKFAVTAEEYTLAIEDLLKLDRRVLAPRLSQRVAGESWEARVEEISGLIGEALVPHP
ncbi:MAG: glycosyltransferase [Candidatus Edwardsbacteria bacterium]|nr:glycosyltransferase [Candidatus Edwardsbacteria bacterium]